MKNQQVSAKKPGNRFTFPFSFIAFFSLLGVFLLFASLDIQYVPLAYASDDCVDSNDDHEDDSDHSVCADPCEDGDHNGEDDSDHGACGCSDTDDDHVEDHDGTACEWESDLAVDKTPPKVKLRNYQIKN